MESTKNLGDQISPAGFRGPFSSSKAYLVLVAPTTQEKPPKGQLSTENWIQLLLSGVSPAFSGTGLYRHVVTVWDLRLRKSLSVCLIRFPILATLNLLAAFVFSAVSNERQKAEGKSRTPPAMLCVAGSLFAPFLAFPPSFLFQVHFSLTRRASGTNLDRSDPSKVSEAPAA